MGKKTNYDDFKLSDAVNKYSLVQTTGIISGTKVAKWAHDNIPGLEDVPEYTFTRPLIQINKETRKKEKVIRPCTVILNQINETRKENGKVGINPILRSGSMDSFFRLSMMDQRAAVLEAREIVQGLIKKNHETYVSEQKLKKDKKELLEEKEDLLKRIASIESKINKLEVQLKKIYNFVDETKCNEMLEKMGIKDGNIYLRENRKSLSLAKEEIINIKKILEDNSEEECSNETGLANIRQALLGDLEDHDR